MILWSLCWIRLVTWMNFHVVWLFWLVVLKVGCPSAWFWGGQSWFFNNCPDFFKKICMVSWFFSKFFVWLFWCPDYFSEFCMVSWFLEKNVLNFEKTSWTPYVWRVETSGEHGKKQERKFRSIHSLTVLMFHFYFYPINFKCMEMKIFM